MKKIKLFKYIISSLIALILFSIVGIFIWTSNTYKPTSEVFTLVGETDCTKENDFYVFKPKNGPNGKGIVLYPGALVEPLSYSYIANELSKKGYLVAIPEVNLNLSVTENNKADEFILKNNEIKNWYVCGHSMGGVSAAYYAEAKQDIVDGVIFLASYPAKKTDLSDNNQKVLSIYAENDGLTSREDIEESKGNLPKNTIFVEIDGGNHAQFGFYGEQKGDKQAEISAKEQQDKIIDLIVTYINPNS
ncbi:alpha/beta hydrolase [Sporanaerobium hydrogeniformans]|uniref:Alpha/beta hydrolase n=1 Tax=Sporanaerobium hydrogeniformans TaxID=3072179 RepID=A0AC61DE18_9FIRM|nr:alpha/beta fold hydrolase [Sporanaerobium hydrogeniformans]PHV71386.1 alpha/beta hydrolase [Sporanaerobium hydrogeniformans]